jgi:hypothetical protein
MPHIGPADEFGPMTFQEGSSAKAKNYSREDLHKNTPQIHKSIPNPYFVLLNISIKRKMFHHDYQHNYAVNPL